MSDLNCPYCGAGLDVCHDDGIGYDEDILHEMQCGVCEKYFVFQTSIIYSYEAEKADCLNGAEHDWQPTHTNPKIYTRMECTMCGERRSCTEEEMAEFLKK